MNFPDFNARIRSPIERACDFNTPMSDEEICDYIGGSALACLSNFEKSQEVEKGTLPWTYDFSLAAQCRREAVLSLRYMTDHRRGEDFIGGLGLDSLDHKRIEAEAERLRGVGLYLRGAVPYYLTASLAAHEAQFDPDPHRNGGEVYTEAQCAKLSSKRDRALARLASAGRTLDKLKERRDRCCRRLLALLDPVAGEG